MTVMGAVFGNCTDHDNCVVKALVGAEAGDAPFPARLAAHAARDFPGKPCVGVEHLEGQLGVKAE